MGLRVKEKGKATQSWEYLPVGTMFIDNSTSWGSSIGIKVDPNLFTPDDKPVVAITLDGESCWVEPPLSFEVLPKGTLLEVE